MKHHFARIGFAAVLGSALFSGVELASHTTPTLMLLMCILTILGVTTGVLFSHHVYLWWGVVAAIIVCISLHDVIAEPGEMLGFVVWYMLYTAIVAEISRYGCTIFTQSQSK